MQHTNQTKFVMYLDDFLDEATLKSLQDTVTKLEYQEVKNPEGQLYGMRHTFDKSIHNDPLIKLIKQYFFPHRNLEPISVCAHLRQNNKEALFHTDEDKGNVANFLFFVKGEPLLNNGTGFMHDNKMNKWVLSSHIGFVENRALFFNGMKIPHSDLQSFGDSSNRYTLNIFYKETDTFNE
jgi:hypothetical protein|tara:strand:- start:940 stop:1479 length:540 start_codon:yes stop_codon:yes gene_type:complete